MGRRHKTLLRWTAFGVAVLSLIATTVTIPDAHAQGADPEAYRYDSEGKPDPFKPFMTIVEEEEKETATVPLSPLERFTVGQFRLTGIAWTRAQKIAIVRSPEGKRHLLHRGTPIGINGGRVIEIRPDSVVILEKIKDFSGKITEERVVLALQKNRENQ